MIRPVLVISSLALTGYSSPSTFFTRQSSSNSLQNIQNKPQEFKHLLPVPLQLAIQNSKSNYELTVKSITHSEVDLLNEHTLDVTAKTSLSNNENCEITGKLDLVEIEMHDVMVKCDESDKLLFLNSEPRVDGSTFNVTNHFRVFWESFGASEAATSLDNGSYQIMKRYKIFAKNLVRMAWMNALERGSAVYGITPYSDLTHEEFNSFYTMEKRTVRNLMAKREKNYVKINSKYGLEKPTGYDWREHDAVTEVKNQGMCGSCWSFSTTGNIEGVHSVKFGELISLSEQELVDCDTVDQGCNGGLMDNAFDQVEKLGGLETEKDYSYTGKAGKCEFDKSKIAVTISGHHDVPQGDEEAMVDQLLETGPLAVALNAMWMQFYRGGVSHPWKRLCNPKGLDHGVLIVGYGVEPADPDHVPLPKKEQPYWIIKNSWGPHWGESGYYRLYRGDGTCGIDQYATTALP